MYVTSAAINQLECEVRNRHVWNSKRTVVVTASDGVGVKIGDVVAAVAANRQIANSAVLSFTGAYWWRRATEIPGAYQMIRKVAPDVACNLRNKLNKWANSKGK